MQSKRRDLCYSRGCEKQLSLNVSFVLAVGGNLSRFLCKIKLFYALPQSTLWAFYFYLVGHPYAPVEVPGYVSLL